MKSCGIFIFILIAVVFSSISSSECCHTQEPKSDSNCLSTERYFRGKCYDVCVFRTRLNAECAENADCYVSAPHTSGCKCKPGYTGAPYNRGCTKYVH